MSVVCRFPNLLPTSGYRRGCRCDRCRAGHALDNWTRRRAARPRQRRQPPRPASPVREQRTAAVAAAWVERIDVAVELPGWTARAACTGRTALMYPDTAAETARALAVCDGCPVRLSCLAAARGPEQTDRLVFGVRGGLTAAQRAAAYRRLDPDVTEPAELDDEPAHHGSAA